jgi:hypothetical protein
MRTCDSNWLLIVAILLVSTGPLYAQQNAAKLKANAQKVVRSISADKAKMQAYCEVTDLGEQLIEAAEDKDDKKAGALMERIDELEKILGPEYPALFNALYDADPNSQDIQDILSMFDRLDESCPH